MSISYYYMCHIFKNRYGVSPNQYHIKKRPELSLKDLLEGTKKIADIATSCGLRKRWKALRYSLSKLRGIGQSGSAYHYRH